MQKIVIILCASVLIIGVAIFLFLPKNYTVTIYSSRYFENCRAFSTDHQNECKKIEPPVIIKKHEPNILSWWNKLQIQRAFKLNEVTVE